MTKLELACRWAWQALPYHGFTHCVTCGQQAHCCGVNSDSRVCLECFDSVHHGAGPNYRRRPSRHPLSENPATIHDWLQANYPKRGVCAGCGKKGRTDYAFTRHPEPHTRNPSDYAELCRSCHNVADGRGGRSEPPTGEIKLERTSRRVPGGLELDLDLRVA